MDQEKQAPANKTSILVSKSQIPLKNATSPLHYPQNHHESQNSPDKPPINSANKPSPNSANKPSPKRVNPSGTRDSKELFEKKHQIWIGAHLSKRKGERKDRLARGHQHAEILFLKNVWFPMFHHFDHLHPEYEVLDWRMRPYFADFVWLHGCIKLLIEIKGYTTHAREMDRLKFSYELNRETFLQSMGFSVISFSYDDVNERPELCIHLLRMFTSRFLPIQNLKNRMSIHERELTRLAILYVRPIRPVDVKNHFQVDNKTAMRWIRSLCNKGVLHPLETLKGQRTTHYQLDEHSVEMLT